MKYIAKSPLGLEKLNKWKSQESESLKSLYSRGNLKAIWARLPSKSSKYPEDGFIDYTKEELKADLNLEQGYICCYCQKRIGNIEEDHDLEHLIPKSSNPEKFTYEYSNLSTSCKHVNYHSIQKERMQNRPLYNATCNEHRKDVILNVLPIDLGVEDRFTYTLNGQIDGIDSDAKRAIEILNLNSLRLITQRNKAIESVLFTIDDIELNDDDLSNILKNLYIRKNNRFEEFCQVLIFIIKFKLSNN